MLRFRVLVVSLLAALPVLSQPPGGNGVSVGPIYLNSADPDANIAFWRDVIGVSTFSNEFGKGVAMSGATVLMTKKAPSGPSAGSTIDHLAVRVPDLQPIVDRAAKSPYKSFRPKAGEDRVMIDGPDGLRVEIVEDASMYSSLEFSHIHFVSAKADEMKAWYAKNIGGRPGNAENVETLQMPGAAVMFTQSEATTAAPGRAIDHLSFEVKDIEAFCKKLAEAGAKIETAPHAEPAVKATLATVTDPWGGRIDLYAR